MLIAAPSWAADYYVRMDVYDSQGNYNVARLPIGSHVTYAIVYGFYGLPDASELTLDLDIPGTIDSIFPVDDRPHCSGEHPIRCTLPIDGVNTEGFLAVETALDSPGAQTAAARISAHSPDPVGDNNVAEWTIEVVDAPSLSAGGFLAGPRLEPGAGGHFAAAVTNRGATARNVVLRVTVPEGRTLAPTHIDGDATCTPSEVEVVCTIAELPFGAAIRTTGEYTAPDRLSGGDVEVHVDARSDDSDFDPSDDTITFTTPLVRHILVTNTLDEGGGSLRQALLDAQLECEDAPCTIDFRIPAEQSENGSFAIRPSIPLPPVRGFVKVDGATQTAFGGDTNPDGPEIVLDGSLLTRGHGLVLSEGCEIQVLGMAIAHFPYPGIEAHRGSYDYERCPREKLLIFPNTLIARNVLTDNYRGIAVVDTAYATISDNIVKNNRRAGIFANRGEYVEIMANRIEGNGASGVYLDVGRRGYDVTGAEIHDNVITNNVEWGIARTNSGQIAIEKNSIFGNGYPAIDLGLDFVTPNRPQDGFDSIPNKPVLFSATYDPARDKTVVTGRLDSDPPTGGWFTIDVYASDGLSRRSHDPEGEQWLTGVMHFTGHADLTIEIDGDFRGKLITATNTRFRILGFAKPPNVSADSHLYSIPADTSELSNAVTVQ